MAKCPAVSGKAKKAKEVAEKEEEKEEEDEDTMHEDDDEEFWDELNRSGPVKAGVDLVLKRGGKPFCDLTGVLRLQEPRRKRDTRDRPAWPIRSRFTSAWIAKLYYKNLQTPLKACEIEDVKLILEGLALDSGMPFEFEDVVEREPALFLIVSLMATCKSWQGTASALLIQLLEQAQREEIEVEKTTRWPKSASHLSVRLGNFADWLAQAGIEYKFKRVQGQRIHSFRQQGDAAAVTSSPSSSPPPSPSKALPAK